MPIVDEASLDRKLGELEVAASWSPRTISKLESFIRSGDDESLFKISPVQFGKDRAVPEGEAIDLFLHGTKAGLFNMEWHLLCPGCGDIIESLASLKSVSTEYHCRVCQYDYSTTLDDYIEVSFSISPEIRRTKFHDLGSLSAEDYFFQYLLSGQSAYPNGKTPREIHRHRQKSLAYVEPNEAKSLAMELDPGFLLCTDFTYHWELFFNVEGEPAGEPQRLDIVIENGAIGQSHSKDAPGTLRPGPLIVNILNKGERRSLTYFQEVGPDFFNMKFEPVKYGNILSGKRLFITKTFADLFRSETIQRKGGLAVRDLTILFTDLKGSTALYDRVGDLKAFSLVQQHFDRLEKVVGSRTGTIVKTIGDAVMAAFSAPADAVGAAMEMLREIDAFNTEYGEKVIVLKIGIHKGTCIAVNLNDRLDYFGKTVNIAARVQALAMDEEIFITQDVLQDPGVAELLSELHVVSEKARLKGVPEEVQVHKIVLRRLNTREGKKFI